MSHLLTKGERFGHLVVVGLISQDDPDGEPRYRCRCLKCGTDCCTAREDALLCGCARLCFDCKALSQMSGSAKTLLAFKKKLDLSPVQVLDYVA